MESIVRVGDTKVQILYTAADIADRVSTMAEEIAKHTSAEGLLFISILKSSFIFSADLVRALFEAGVAPEIDFIALSSYGMSKKSSGTVEIVRDITIDVDNRDVVIVDDILESGHTLKFAKTLFEERGAKSVRTVTLLDKPVNRKVDIQADFSGFVCDDVFVIGYGMDGARRYYRGLPFIGVTVDETSAA